MIRDNPLRSKLRRTCPSLASLPYNTFALQKPPLLCNSICSIRWETFSNLGLPHAEAVKEKSFPSLESLLHNTQTFLKTPVPDQTSDDAGRICWKPFLWLRSGICLNIAYSVHSSMGFHRSIRNIWNIQNRRVKQKLKGTMLAPVWNILRINPFPSTRQSYTDLNYRPFDDTKKL